MYTKSNIGYVPDILLHLSAATAIHYKKNTTNFEQYTVQKHA